MISAKRARLETQEYIKNRTQIICVQKILEKNKNKEFFIPLPFKLPIVESLMEQARKNGLSYCKIDNEITPEVEECLIDNGYTVKYYKNFIKISW